MTQKELWEWMMDGKYPPGYPDYDRPELVPIERRAFAILSRDVEGSHFTDHGKPSKPFKWKAGTRVKVVMVSSRFGDVGITDNLAAQHGYSYRVQCLDGEEDVFGGKTKVIQVKAANLLTNIEYIEDQQRATLPSRSSQGQSSHHRCS